MDSGSQQGTTLCDFPISFCQRLSVAVQCSTQKHYLYFRNFAFIGPCQLEASTVAIIILSLFMQNLL